MEKRALIAVVLSLAVWIIWFYIFPPQENKNQAPIEKDQSITDLVKETQRSVPTAMYYKPQNVKEQNVFIESKFYSVTLSNSGGECVSFIDKTRNIELVVTKSIFDAKGTFDFQMHFSPDEFLNANLSATGLWKSEISDKEVAFSSMIMMDNKALEIKKVFTFNDLGQYFYVTYTFTNKSNTEISFPEGMIIYSPSDFLGPSMDFNNSYNELHSIYYKDGDFEKARKSKGLFSTPEDMKRESGVIQWVGIMSRYYLLIMIPQGFVGSEVLYDNREHKGFRTGIVVPMKPLQAGASVEHKFKVYVGPKSKDKLLAVDNTIGDAADVSKWIEPIRDFMMWCLLEINKVVGNLGWSLVIFSIITKIMFLPLTQRSTESMKKMQELNPIILELREKYKDRPDVLNKKIMEVYRKHKVNPLGGCLPLILQLPFFFALYSALVNSVDLWKAPFILWIKDLSLPDTIWTVAGFNVNILPLIMTGTTYAMQKMSTVETTQQRALLLIMPALFIVIFWNMPSGLVLYWTMQNVLQIAHQMIINKWSKKK